MEEKIKIKKEITKIIDIVDDVIDNAFESFNKDSKEKTIIALTGSIFSRILELQEEEKEIDLALLTFLSFLGTYNEILTGEDRAYFKKCIELIEYLNNFKIE